ncbi:hypothetical protein ACJ72_02450 [Emergomyces africanus]|uniref:Aminoglycoside phosphotransferase domain-containing protein n=1 Tax=Emergomyces africanus TaxID=1955775 RepID=A0A1B7P2E1_9EURO|nr:hypothetical protein ACJ72_02450 [Emergomyces africanus]
MPKETEKAKAPPPRDWIREKLDAINIASILCPLSEQALAFVLKYSKANSDSDYEKSLAASLRTLILHSERLFELRIRGAVVKCSDEIVIKILPNSRDPTEYPSPLKSRGPDSSHETKLSIKKQLDLIFSRLISLWPDDGPELGGIGGEGVKDYRIMEIFAYKDILLQGDSNELQFAAKHRASACYVKLLRSFLEEQNSTLQRSVFTHGDLKKSNIMVQQHSTNANVFTVTGIIDWEDSGFSPEYYECTTLSNGQSIVTDDDWYLYIPDCISPLRFPVRWLVDRLWDNLLWSRRTDIVR